MFLKLTGEQRKHWRRQDKAHRLARALRRRILSIIGDVIEREAPLTHHRLAQRLGISDYNLFDVLRVEPELKQMFFKYQRFFKFYYKCHKGTGKECAARSVRQVVSLMRRKGRVRHYDSKRVVGVSTLLPAAGL